MIRFPCCKINLGLRVLRRRGDGYHEIETAMIPVPGLSDALEILPDELPDIRFSASGLTVDGPPEDNLCVRAYRLMRERYAVGGVKMHLHKHIPFGAGLGGGSSDAAVALAMLDELFGLGLPRSELAALAAELGSDAPFFLFGRPMLARERGELLSPLDLDLDPGRCHILIVKPPFGVSTAEAYRGVSPSLPDSPLAEILAGDRAQWKNTLVNDFEPSVFRKHPVLADIKRQLYDLGAFYASMSGSGPSVFGLFDDPPRTPCFPETYFVYSGGM